MTVALNAPKIFEVNKQAIECVSNALSRLGEEREVDIYSSAAYNEIAVLIDTQNSLVDEYIRTSLLTQLSRALKIQRLATQCTILTKIINYEKYRYYSRTHSQTGCQAPRYLTLYCYITQCFYN